MTGLRELQQAFGESLRSEQAMQLAPWICADGIPGMRRVQIYRNNHATSLTEALRAAYPVVEKLVSEGFFRFAAHRYTRKFPSTEGNLHGFGRDFARFLGQFPPAKDHRYLPDVARLEWARHEVYHAGGHAPMAPQSLAAVDPAAYESLRFTIHPARRLLRSPYPVVRIWEVNQPDWKAGQTVDLSASGDRVLVLRTQGQIEFHRLAPAEYRFLDTLSAGCTLGRAAEAALAREPDFDLNRSLVKHVQNHTLVGFALA